MRGLNPSAGLPHRQTCIKLLGLMRTLTENKLEVVISMQRVKFGDPFAGTTSDIWSTSNCRASFFCMRLSMVLEPEIVFAAASTGSKGSKNSSGSTYTRPTGLTEVAPMICFREFTETSHSGKVIASVKKSALAKYKMSPDTSLSLMTEDGASNNKSSAKQLQAPFKVCCPHDLQRAVLFAADEAGSVSQNPELKEFIQKASKMASAPHRSTATSDRLQKAQIEGGTPKSRVVVTETANVTRWTGLYRMAYKVGATPATITSSTITSSTITSSTITSTATTTTTAALATKLIAASLARATAESYPREAPVDGAHWLRDGRGDGGPRGSAEQR